MKIVYVFVFFVLFSTLNQAQFKPLFDKKTLLNQNTWSSKQMPSNEIHHSSDLVSNSYRSSFPNNINTTLTDTMKYNKYGGLLNDNPLYYKKSSLAMVAFRVTLSNVSTFLIDRYIFNYEFSRVGFNSWKNNMQKGWEWDQDRFGMNYFFHPYSGAMFFNSARVNGYSFFESLPFAYLGSLEWEYFGENTRPSYNDIINTPITGAFLGEIFYRMGSNILDDQTTGADRFFREMAVAIMTPTRFFNRLLHGELTRSTSDDIYQKEPLNITMAVGYHKINKGTPVTLSMSSLNFNFHFDYGNPFEKRSRKPFDFFKIRTNFNFGVGRKIIENATGNGILFGSNVQVGNFEMLTGLFQNMDYYDNKTFELGAMAFGPGVISKLKLSKSSSLNTSLHIDIMPFGALSNKFGPDTTQVRDYDYAGGAEAKLESDYNFGWASIALTAYYWWFHTFVGVAENSYIALIKPSITFKLYNNVNIGFEHLIHYTDRYPKDFASIHSVRTEEKIFFQIFFEEFKFKRK